MIPFITILALVGLAAMAWWVSKVPLVCRWSLKTNRRLLKAGFIIGVMGLLIVFSGHPPEVGLLVGVVVVIAIWCIDTILRARIKT